MRIDVAMLVLSTALLAACGDSGDSRESVIGEPLHESLERARAVEDTVRQQAEETRRQIEQAEGR